MNDIWYPAIILFAVGLLILMVEGTLHAYTALGGALMDDSENNVQCTRPGAIPEKQALKELHLRPPKPRLSLLQLVALYIIVIGLSLLLLAVVY